MNPPPPPAPTTSGPHTDQCIRDAARYGFCDHTSLTASSAQLRARDRARAARPIQIPDVIRAHPALRELLGWVGLLLISLTFYALATHPHPPAFTQHPVLHALIVTNLIGLGWLLVFTCGLPRGLTADLSHVVPPDARNRLDT